MNISISELKELAVAVSCHLKNLDPSTMFWNFLQCQAFTNHNQFVVQPHQAQKKHFGTQSILESFAKSLGYNTYNGLLASGVQNVQLADTALNHLNVNPLNPYFTECWEVFAQALFRKILDGDAFHYSLIRNFKNSYLMKFTPFAQPNGSIASLLQFKQYKPSNPLEVTYSNLIDYYAIADAIFHYGLERLIEREGLNGWFESKDVDLKFLLNFKNQEPLEPLELDFSEFLIKNEWEDFNHSKFTQAVIRSIETFFRIRVNFIGGESSPLTKKIKLSYHRSNIDDYMIGRVHRIQFNNFKKASLVKFAEHESDQALYKADKQEIGHNIVNTEPLFNNWRDVDNRARADIQVGTKAYWINSCFGYISRKLDVSEQLGLWTEEQFAVEIDAFLNQYLKNADANIKHYPNAYTDFKYQQKLKLNCEGFQSSNVVIPEYVKVVSNQPLHYNIAEIFVQSQLLRMLHLHSNYSQLGWPDRFGHDSLGHIDIVKTNSAFPITAVYELHPLAFIEQFSIDFDYFLKIGESVRNKDLKDLKLFDENDHEYRFIMKFMLSNSLFRTFESSDDWEGDWVEIPMDVRISKATNDVEVSYLDLSAYNSNRVYSAYENCEFNDDICRYLISLSSVEALVKEKAKQVIEDGMGKYLEDIEELNIHLEMSPADLYRKNKNVDWIIRQPMDVS